jgi:hypothetical protein
VTGPLSTYGQLLLDYATQEAKRSGQAHVTAAHVAVAVARREPEASIRELGGDVLSAARSEAASSGPRPLAPPDVDPEVLTLLADVHDCADQWPVLRAGLSRLLHGVATSAMGSFLDQFISVVASLGDDVAPGAEGRWQAPDAARRAILDDLWGLFSWIASADHVWSEPELAAVHDFFDGQRAPGVDVLAPTGTPPTPAAPPASCVLAPLARHDPSSASAYASGLIHVGRFLSSIDNAVGAEEAHALDDLRLGYRAVLTEVAPTKAPGEPHVADGLAELDSLIGLAEVKRDVREFVDLAWINRLRSERGQPATQPTLHMAFLGNPGTGKTTVARLVGKVLGSAGILPTGGFMEVDRTALVGEYIGQSGPKARDLILKARGGVLFIDEAYSLVPPKNYASYEGEVIAVLVQMMEELRDQLLVIAAGYPDLMAKFFDANPGLGSRFATHITFADYGSDELMAIFDRFCHADGRRCEEGVCDRVRAVLEVARLQPDFGNAREVRNIYEILERNQAERLSSLGELATDEELATFALADAPQAPVGPAPAPPPADGKHPPGQYL